MDTPARMSPRATGEGRGELEVRFRSTSYICPDPANGSPTSIAFRAVNINSPGYRDPYAFLSKPAKRCSISNHTGPASARPRIEIDIASETHEPGAPRGRPGA